MRESMTLSISASFISSCPASLTNGKLGTLAARVLLVVEASSSGAPVTVSTCFSGVAVAAAAARAPRLLPASGCGCDGWHRCTGEPRLLWILGAGAAPSHRAGVPVSGAASIVAGLLAQDAVATAAAAITTWFPACSALAVHAGRSAEERGGSALLLPRLQDDPAAIIRSGNSHNLHSHLALAGHCNLPGSWKDGSDVRGELPCPSPCGSGPACTTYAGAASRERAGRAVTAQQTSSELQRCGLPVWT